MYNNLEEHEKSYFLCDLEDQLAMTDHPSPNVFIEKKNIFR